MQLQDFSMDDKTSGMHKYFLLIRMQYSKHKYEFLYGIFVRYSTIYHYPPGTDTVSLNTSLTAVGDIDRI